MPDILLIDDNKNYCFGLAGNLRKAGFNVESVSDGNEALKLLNKIHPDIILCDVNMPAPDGMEIKRILNQEKQTASIPFIFLSALSYSNVKTNGLNIGADDFITKSIDMLELIARIQVILRRKKRAVMMAREEVEQLVENLSTSLPIHTSHHFRTYLGILTMSLEMIAKNQSTNDEYLEFARNTAYRMKVWMETLIWLNEYDLGRHEKNRIKIDIDMSFVFPVKEVLKAWDEKNLTLDLKIDPNTEIYVPARSFGQALSHLVDNACKFSPKNGIVKISLVTDDTDIVYITIEDEGIGIPVEKREDVFNRFSQIQGKDGLAENQGMGLGLYMAKTFVSTLGGDVKILDSEKGCKIQIRFESGKKQNL
ncbi:MAG: response regulator [Chloroflexota bacterium]